MQNENITHDEKTKGLAKELAGLSESCLAKVVKVIELFEQGKDREAIELIEAVTGKRFIEDVNNETT